MLNPADLAQQLLQYTTAMTLIGFGWHLCFAMMHIYFFTTLPSLHWCCNVVNLTMGWCVILGHVSCLWMVYVVLGSGADWLKGQDAVSVIFRRFYGLADKIRTPSLWGWLLCSATHSSSVYPSHVCANTSVSVLGSVYTHVVGIVFHTYHSFQTCWFISKPHPLHWLTDCLLHGLPDFFLK